MSARPVVKTKTYTLPKMMVLVPSLAVAGGVSNYYNTLGFNNDKRITYFEISKSKQESMPAMLFRLLTNYGRFFYNLLKYKYEVVMVNPSLDQGKSFHRDLVFIGIARLLNRKTIVFFRGWFEPYEDVIKRSAFKSFLFRNTYAKADRYFVLGNIFKKKLLSLGVPTKSNFTLETTVADSRFLQEFTLSGKHASYDDEVQFLFLGRIEREKGIFIAIDAFKILQTRFPAQHMRLSIAGDGPGLTEVKQYIEQLSIRNIVVLGHVSADKKKKVLLESHIMLLPSYTEGLPNCILEGMLYGMPIIARATGGIPDVIANDVNGFISESFDPGVFADYMARFIANASLYREMGERNHFIALNRFTPEIVKDRMLTHFQDYSKHTI